MAGNERSEMITAFAIGAVIGVGATLLLRPEPTARERMVRQMKPLVRRARKAGHRSRRGFERGIRATRETGADMAEASREILEDFRDRLDRIVESAARDAKRAVKRRTKIARNAIARHNRWF